MASTIDRTHPFIGTNLGVRIAVLAVAILPLLFLPLLVYFAFGNGVDARHILLFVGMWAFTGMGISVGYHRMLTHRAFQASAPIRYLALLGGVMSLQGGPASWAATHQRHHSKADTDEDPHSPMAGLFHAHFGWLFRGRLVHSGPAHDKLMQDPVVRHFERFQALYYTLSIAGPGFIGMAIGIGFLEGALWGGALRLAFGHHVTWSINSICHTWGTRPYDSPDLARNNAIFAVLGWGEGWHNNHHAQPRSAYLGHRWYQFDMGRMMIRTLAALGLVQNVVKPERQSVKRVPKGESVPTAA